MARHVIVRAVKISMVLVLFLVSSLAMPISPNVVEAKTTKKSTKKRSTKKRSTKRRSTRRRSSRRRSTRSRSRRRSTKRRSSRRRRSRRTWKRRRPRYAYPYDFFMMNAPSTNRLPLAQNVSSEIMRAFVRGEAGNYTSNQLVRAGVFKYHALKGGIFHRREPIKYIIMHSTETGNPNMGAQRIINSWSSRGRRHPGAQFVIARDGQIWQSVDPDMGTVHVNIFKTIPGVNNDNCIGIEMIHSGRQNYPPALITSAVRLVNYLQERYGIPDENITTHRYVQNGDHTDPVNFNWAQFIIAKNKLRTLAMNSKLANIREAARGWQLEQQKIPGVKKVQGEILKPKVPEVPEKIDDTNLLELKKEPEIKTPELKAKPKEFILDETLIEPKAPSTLLQLRGPIELDPEDAKKLMDEGKN